MTGMEPVAELDARFSSDAATPASWSDARGRLEQAQVSWLSTVRPDGRPHVTPLLSIWLDDALYFCTGPSERKARNLEHNPHCILTTGCNGLDEGLDLVVEGDAAKVRDEPSSAASPTRTSRSTAPTGTSTCATAPSSGMVVKPWCTRSLPPRPSRSPRASTARPGGGSGRPERPPGEARTDGFGFGSRFIAG